MFQPRQIVDLDGDGKLDLVGAWYVFGMEPIFPAPVVITWDDARSQYVMHPMLSRPTLNPQKLSMLVAAHGPSAVFRRDKVYDRPRTLEDRLTGERVRVFGAEDFLLARGTFSPHVLVAVYSVRQRYEADRVEAQLVPWAVTLLGSDVDEYPCVDLRKPLLFDGYSRASLPRAWTRVRSRVFC